MFKELKLIKSLVFIGLLVILFVEMDFSSLIVKELYTDKPSYVPGEEVKIYISTVVSSSFFNKIEITDISGRVVDSFRYKVSNNKLDNTKVLENGLGIDEYTSYLIPIKLKSGIYLINKKYPLIIKAKEQTEITVVYPYINNLLYTPNNNKTVFSEKIKKTSLLRTSILDSYSEGLESFFTELDSTYSLNYIADIDLEKIEKFNSSRLIIFYGKLSNWTPKMRENTIDYIQRGGNFLIMSTYISNNICWYNAKNSEVILYDEKSKAIQSWEKYDSINGKNLFAISYVNGGYSNNETYKIVNNDKEIFREVIDEEIKIKANLYASPPVKWDRGEPIVQLDSIDFYKAEIWAYNTASYRQIDEGIKGIFMLQPDSLSGKILSLGTEDWCLKENFAANSNIQLITRNAVSYLLK